MPTTNDLDIHDILLGRTFKKVHVLKQYTPYAVYLELVAGEMVELHPVTGVIFTDLFINTMYRAQPITEMKTERVDDTTVSFTIGNDHHVMAELLMETSISEGQPLFTVKRVAR